MKVKISNSGWVAKLYADYFEVGSTLTWELRRGSVCSPQLSNRTYTSQAGFTSSVEDLQSGEYRVVEVLKDCVVIETDSSTPTTQGVIVKNKLFKGVIVKTVKQKAAENTQDSVDVEKVAYASDEPILAADAGKARDILIANALAAKAITIVDLTNQVEPVEPIIKEY